MHQSATRIVHQVRFPAPCAAALALAMIAATGCSQDRHVFESTIDRPTTVTLVDPLSDKELWTKPIPVQHRLVVDLDRSGEFEPASVSGKPPTTLHWSLYGPRGFIARESDTVALPGTPVLLKVTHRPSPEYPEDTPGQAAPAADTGGTAGSAGLVPGPG